ncbi:hypothetical protein JZ751_002120 [Albula glossodonta]|uniref:Uncharacterized protein n=1 Tax=Albula glossodonta TaxID=121402 RepID=A0A8T2P755_9TELE|nr:hypothetical protein JZ751_002120 [Albula glossodonta]
MDSLQLCLLSETLEEHNPKQIQALAHRLQMVNQALQRADIQESSLQSDGVQEQRGSMEDTVLTDRLRVICSYLQQRVESLHALAQAQMDYGNSIQDFLERVEKHWTQLEELHVQVTLTKQKEEEIENCGKEINGTVECCVNQGKERNGMEENCVNQMKERKGEEENFIIPRKEKEGKKKKWNILKKKKEGQEKTQVIQRRERKGEEENEENQVTLKNDMEGKDDIGTALKDAECLSAELGHYMSGLQDCQKHLSSSTNLLQELSSSLQVLGEIGSRGGEFLWIEGLLHSNNKQFEEVNTKFLALERLSSCLRAHLEGLKMNIVVKRESRIEPNLPSSSPHPYPYNPPNAVLPLYPLTPSRPSTLSASHPL